LDACVLFPIAVADALMSLATAGLFAAKWTAQIEEEWIKSLEDWRPELKGKLEDRRRLMREAVPDWEVPPAGWQALVACINLPDPNDHHVLAAAIAGHADCIVTSNLKDFPAAVVQPFGIEILHPDEFIIKQWDLDELAAVAAFKRMRARRKNPEATAEDFAQAMERNGLAATAERLRDAAELI
jgi:predicted nucleic acid-binding protein